MEGGKSAIYHRTVRGETLFSISNLYETSVADLKALNGISDTMINAGQQLIVGYNAMGPSVRQKEEKTDHFEEIISSIDQLTLKAFSQNRNMDGKGSIKSIEKLFQSKVANNRSFDLINALNLEKIKDLNSDLGLQWTNNYTRNFEPGILNAEDIFFNSRLSTGVSWEILGNGVQGNKLRASVLKKEIEINELLEIKSVKKENYSYLYNYLIYSFNRLKGQHLEERVELIASFLKIASKLYYIRAVSWEEIIQWKSELQELQELLKNIKTYDKVFSANYGKLNFDAQVNATQLPVLEVDLGELMGEEALDSIDLSLLNLHRERLALSHRRTNEIGLSAQLKYNVLTGQASENARTYGSFGLSLTAPLFKNKRNSQRQEKEAAVIEQQLVYQASTINNEVMNLYSEYQYMLKQYISFVGKRGKIEERLRKAKDRKLIHENDYSTISSLSMLNELKAIDFELVDIKQRLYLQLLKIYTLTDVTSLGEFTRPAEIHTSFGKSRGNRGVYLWSNTLEEIGKPYLLRYLANNDIDRVMFSPGKNKIDVSGFLSEAVADGRLVYRLIGENSYVTKGFTDNLRQKIEGLNPLYDGIHLDIEPQALEDWSTNKAQYLTNFIDILQTSKSVLSKDKTLSVSIPVFFPQKTLEKIFRLADEVVLMAYGKAEVSFIKRKISEESAIPGAVDKLTVALRASDFEDRIQMESLIDELIDQTGIQNFIIQDFGELISLDQKTILGELKGGK